MKRKYIIVALLVLAGLVSWAMSPIHEISRHGFAMNTLIRMSIYTQDDKLMDDAYSLLASLDHQLSMYDPSSDISRINSHAGIEKVSVPPSVLEVVNDSRRLYDITGGIFNPLIGAVTRLWKINRADNTTPSHESLASAIALSDIENLEITDGSIYLRKNGCVLDLGGIAKGYASKKIADMLADNGVKSGLIDLGGNIYVVGKKPDGMDWRIGIRDPLDPLKTPALALKVNNCSVITSGGYERFKIVDGKRYSHFFDPKTGNSVMSDLLSVTLVTPDGSLADGLATAFMIAGCDKSAEILQNISPMPGVVFIRESSGEKLEILVSDNLKDKVINARYPVKFFTASLGIQ